MPACPAQYTTYGSWEGSETVTITTLNAYGQQTGQTTENYLTTLTIQLEGFPGSPPIDALLGTLSMTDVTIDGPVSLTSYGADGLSGSILENEYPAGFAFAYFDAIPGSYANTTFTGDYYDPTSNDYTDVSASFQSVPEPTAFAEALLAIVSIAAFACVRRLRSCR